MSSKCCILAAASLFFVPSAVAQSGPSDSVTVEQAIRMVVENYPLIKQTEREIVASDAIIEQSRSGYYPDVSGLASFARIGPVPSFDIPGQGSLDLAPANNYDIQVGLQQTLYDFGKRSAGVDLARSGRESALESAESAKLNLAYQAVQSFYAIIFLRKNISVIEEQINALNQHLEITRNKVRAGTATNFEILTTEVRIANVRSRRVDIATGMQAQEIIFRQLTGLEPDSPLILKGNFSVEPADFNADSLISLALDQLPEMRISRNSEISADLRRRLASLGNHPSLAADLSFGFKNGYTPNLNEMKANWVAGMQIRAPIFDGHLTRAKERQARANLQAARYHTEDLGRRIAAAVEQALAMVLANQEKLEAAEPQVNQAEEALALARAKYGAGTATNLDLLDAETALADARLIRLKAMYDIVNARYALGKAVGEKLW